MPSEQVGAKRSQAMDGVRDSSAGPEMAFCVSQFPCPYKAGALCNYQCWPFSILLTRGGKNSFSGTPHTSCIRAKAENHKTKLNKHTRLIHRVTAQWGVLNKPNRRNLVVGVLIVSPQNHVIIISSAWKIAFTVKQCIKYAFV